MKKLLCVVSYLMKVVDHRRLESRLNPMKLLLAACVVFRVCNLHSAKEMNFNWSCALLIVLRY